ncbi:MAG TPA: hypothetical protein VF787_22725 [Thermoanaerobaculia bacterium]
MPQLRIALTVLPVGPRGQKQIEASDKLWFALQISAGFDTEVTATKEEVAKLWPWKLHVPDTGKVKLNAWVGAAQTPVEAVIEDDAFAKDLRDAIAKTYEPDEARKGLDLRLLTTGADETYERANFPARVQYLATLPGELSSRLMSTLYVQIDRAALFNKNGNVWEPKAKQFFLVPHEIQHDAKVTLDTQPADTGLGDGTHQVTNGDVMAIGPGFVLEGLADPKKGVFDLESYAVEVGNGDRRFIELESIILDAHDPFAQIDGLQQRGGRENLRLVDSVTTNTRVVPEETFAALLEAWRVRAFASELRATFPNILTRLHSLLVPGDATVLQIPDRWAAGFTNAVNPANALLDVARVLASRLGIPDADNRTILRRVSDASGYAAIGALAAQAFDEALSASAATPALKEAWIFKPRDPETLPLDRNGIAERRIALAQTAARLMREDALVAPTFDALKSVVVQKDNAPAKLRESLHGAIEKTFQERRKEIGVLVALGLASPSETKLDGANDFDKTQAQAHLASVWPETPAATTELPGRGLSLVVGGDGNRVAHEAAKDEHGRDLYREIGGVLLFARRASIESELKDRDWRILTGGTAFLGQLGNRVFAPGQTPEIENKEWLQRLLAIPIRPVFQQKIARADLEYHGQPMLAQSPLDQAYQADEYEAENAGGLPEAFSYQSLGNFEGTVGDLAVVSRAPALRYGDHYEFLGRLIDQAGGLATDTQDAKPWKLHVPPKTATGAPMSYLRKVPVGDLNVLPGETERANWPALANDVSLRAREWWGLTHSDVESLPALLVSENVSKPELKSYAFRVLAPATDEHTLVRWAAPAVGDAERDKKIERLTEALTQVFDQRLLGAARVLHDPAVTRIGVRIRGAGAANIIEPVFSETIALEESAEIFQQKPLTIRVTASASAAKPTATKAGLEINVTIPNGTFAVLEVFPLVAVGDFARFNAMPHLVDASEPFSGHVAFHPSVVLLEGATAALPTEGELYEQFKLSKQTNGDIAIRFEKPVDNLVFVDRFAIERERWVWRNLPIVPEQLPGNDAEKRRILASGPPLAAFGATVDTDSDVENWERIAGLDRGFVDRGEVGGRWPRADAVDSSAGGPAANVLLAVDNRDGVSSADYLRYGLRVRSRYAGVLTKKEATAVSVSKSIRRRIATGFRGTKVKPPKILAVVPLTASLEADPLKRPAGVSPFAVLLDETFFREYGIGERLEVMLTLVNLDIGEPEDSAVPYRTGPLPDHYLKREGNGDARYFRGARVKPGEESIFLDAFGPFGYSLDITPSEALANASAFVIYAPSDVGAHWSMFAHFRRVLDLPSAKATHCSDWSDAHALYTLPDEHRLFTSSEGSRPKLEIAGTTATLRDFTLVLDPTAVPPSKDGKPLKNSEAWSQYRYFVLISRVLAGAGQGFDAELPVAIARIPRSANGFIKPGSFDVEHASGASLTIEAPILATAGDKLGGELRGRVLEILINGQYSDASRLDSTQTWKDFWESMLDAKEAGETDAAGMVRRVSKSFVVSMG